MRYVMGMGRSVHRRFKDVQCHFKKRSVTSPIIPDAYNVCNSTTIDSDLTLNLLEGEVPVDLDGIYIFVNVLAHQKRLWWETRTL